jgi:hypothetical protein
MQNDLKDKTLDIFRPKAKKDNLQTISLDEWLNLRQLVLNDTSKQAIKNLPERQSWTWVFSIQILYGLMIKQSMDIR